MMKRALLMIALLAAGCSEYSASQYHSTSAAPTADRRAAFDSCNHETWRNWGSEPHPAYVFGAAGALLDDSVSGPPAGYQMARCMASLGYAKN
jgi:hypothetical protein